MAREHAVIEFSQGAYHLTNMDPVNPVQMNGVADATAELKSGDRFAIGAYRFEYVLRDRESL